MNRIRRFATLGAVLALFTAQTVWSQTQIRPGFNVFSSDQDVEIGRQSAAQIDRQLPAVRDPEIQRYVSAVGTRLAAHAPGPQFTYHFKVVNLSDVNAFALPGGYVYVHRGLLEQVRTEGELAGVMAHEIAHVALRHPTNQASKAYLAQAGIGLLGGLLGGGHSSGTGQIMSALGGVGLNALFLKFSRTAESQADIAGAQIMDKAGYDPVEMANFFDVLARQANGNPSKFAVFLSDHPAPADRQARVRQEAQMLGRPGRTTPVGNLAMVQAESRRLGPAPSLAQLAKGETPSGTSSGGTSSSLGAGLTIEAPSSQYRVARQPSGLFQLEAPSNWSVFASNTDYGLTMVPRGGTSTSSSGRETISHGVIVNHYVPFEGAIDESRYPTMNSGTVDAPDDLQAATHDLIDHIQLANPYLRQVSSPSRRTMAGQPSIQVELTGRSPENGIEQRVTLLTRALPDGHVLYMLLMAPSDEYAALQPTFDHMVTTLRADRRASHD